MSCHFHKLRRRKAVEAAQKAAETVVAIAPAEVKEELKAVEAAQKAAKGRRKGDA